VLLTHSPEAEKAWMAEGNGTSRRLVMYNDFVIIGPEADPAKVKGLRRRRAEAHRRDQGPVRLARRSVRHARP